MNIIYFNYDSLRDGHNSCHFSSFCPLPESQHFEMYLVVTAACAPNRVDLHTLGEDTPGGEAQKEQSRQLLDAAAEIFAFSGSPDNFSFHMHCSKTNLHLKL